MKSRATAKTSARKKTRLANKTLLPAKIRITATEAARKFSEILNRVAYKRESLSWNAMASPSVRFRHRRKKEFPRES